MEFLNNVLKIPNATESLTDAAQYMIRHGRKQYNLCGEFCVAYCMQDEAHTDNIEEFLNYWEAHELKWYRSVFQGGLARTTGIYDLEKMLSAYGVETPCKRLTEWPVKPISFEAALQDQQAIVGVQIDHTGYLVGRGIAHWEVLESVQAIDAQHAICKLYNPFTNAIRPYTWRELMTATGAYKQGIWVERFGKNHA